MISDLPPKIWLPPKPAIIRPAPIQKANFLPGMFPGGALMGAAPAAALETLSHITAATSTTATINVPGAAAVGDLMVLSDHAVGNPPDTVLASGFTSLFNDVQDTFFRHIISAKIVTLSDLSTTLTGMDGTSDGGTDNKILDVYRGNVPITAFNPYDFAQSYSSTGNPASQTIDGSISTVPAILLAFYFSDGLISPRTFTAAKDGETDGSGDNGFWSAWKIYNVGDTPADHTVDMDDEGNRNRVIKGVLELS